MYMKAKPRKSLSSVYLVTYTVCIDFYKLSPDSQLVPLGGSNIVTDWL